LRSAAELLLSTAGFALGLLISAVSRTEEVVLALVQVAVIPQIALAGVVAPLTGGVELLAKGFAASYWDQLGLERLTPGVTGSLVTPAVVLATQAAACLAGTLVALCRRAR
jgi:hypothetical protein